MKHIAGDDARTPRMLGASDDDQRAPALALREVTDGLKLSIGRGDDVVGGVDMLQRDADDAG